MALLKCKTYVPIKSMSLISKDKLDLKKEEYVSSPVYRFNGCLTSWSDDLGKYLMKVVDRVYDFAQKYQKRRAINHVNGLLHDSIKKKAEAINIFFYERVSNLKHHDDEIKDADANCVIKKSFFNINLSYEDIIELCDLISESGYDCNIISTLNKYTPPSKETQIYKPNRRIKYTTKDSNLVKVKKRTYVKINAKQRFYIEILVD